MTTSHERDRVACPIRISGNDAQPSATTATATMAAGAAAMAAGKAAACTAMSAGEAGLPAGSMGDEGGPAASTVGNYCPMAIMRAVVMVVHPMTVPVVVIVHPTIVPAVVIVASIMVPIAAHKPERVQVAVVIVIGVAVVAVVVRVIGPRSCTSRQGDTDAKHQTWSKQKLPALRDTHDNLTTTRVDKSSVNLTWAPTDAERCGDSATLMGLLRAIRMSGVNQSRADAFRVGQS